MVKSNADGLFEDRVEQRAEINVAVVEDDEVLRKHFITSIEAEDDLCLVWSASSVANAMSEIEGSIPDVALIDLGLPDGSGAQIIEKLRENSHTKILVVTVFDDRTSVKRAIASGADGYLVKDSNAADILKSIKSLVSGGAPISSSAAIHLLNLAREKTTVRPENSVPADAQPPSLTKREVEVLELFSRGLTYEETASCLNVSKHTIGDYVKSIYRKLSVNSRSEAIFEAVNWNFIKLS